MNDETRKRLTIRTNISPEEMQRFINAAMHRYVHHLDAASLMAPTEISFTLKRPTPADVVRENLRAIFGREG